MKDSGGIFRDSSLEDIPEGKYYHALNAIFTEKKGTVENEPGTSQFGTTLTGDIVGVRPLENGDTIFFIEGATIDSIVLVAEDGTQTVVVDDNDLSSTLGFSTSTPVQAEFYVNSNEERIVAFIQDDKKPRIISIEDTIAEVLAGNTPIPIGKLDLLPVARYGPVVATSLAGGGSLTSGSYSIIYRYGNNLGGVTDWSTPATPVPVSSNSSPFEGSPGGNVSGYGIQVDLGTNLLAYVDEDFDFIEWGAIKSTDGQLTAFKFNKTVISDDYISLVLSTEINTEDLLLEEVLVVNSAYETAKAVTQLNNQLFLGNLTSADDPLTTFQQDVANLIELSFTRTGLVDSILDTPAREELIGRPTFMPGEVYAFYIQVQIDGKWSRAFHIPGPVLGNNSNTDPYTDNVAYGTPTTISGGTVSAGTYKRYQIEDTANATTNRLGGYYNMDEVYPTDPKYDSSGLGGTDLRGLSVRHHKFPSIRKAHIDDGASPVRIDIFGIEIDNIDLTNGAGYENIITGFRLLHAERNFQNSTTLGQSVLVPGGEDVVINTNKYSAAGGFAITPGPTGGLGNDIDHTTDHFRWHGFDVLKSKPSVNINNLRIEMYYDDLDRERLNTSSTDTSNERAEILDPRRPAAPTQVTPANILITTTINLDAYIPVNAKQYVPNGVSLSLSLNGTDVVYNNIAGEEHLLLEAERTTSATPGAKSSAFEHSKATADGEAYDLYIATALNLQRNVYSSFDNQKLRPIAEFHVKDGLTTYSGVVNNLTAEGGDAFAGGYGIICTGPLSTDTSGSYVNGIANEGGNILGEGVKTVIYFPKVYSNLNISARYSETAQGFYMPKFDPQAGALAAYVASPLAKYDINDNLDILYNDDHTLKIPELTNSVAIDNVNQVIDNKFPNLTIRSVVQNNQSVTTNWQEFPILDNYTIGREKGPITNLQGASNSRLYIHTTNSLYITKNRTVLTSSAADVTLGSGNIFDIPPVEVVPSGSAGFTGTSSPLACIMTKIGYVFPNLEEGKIFLHNGEALNEISNTGMRTFFKSQLEVSNVTGIITVYDEEYNRILITYKGDQRNSGLALNWTVSYSPELNSFVSFHSYQPDFYFSHPNLKLFSIIRTGGNSLVYQHNDQVNGIHGVYLNDATVNPFEYTAVYNTHAYEEKYFSHLEWVTEIRTNPYKGAGLNTETTVSGETFTNLEISSVKKSTGEIALIPRTSSKLAYTGNIRNVENIWKFNSLRNELDSAAEIIRNSDSVERETDIRTSTVSLQWYRKARFVESYILVTYKYDNSNDYKFSFLEHTAVIRKSFR